jgi:hypothetical protein
MQFTSDSKRHEFGAEKQNSCAKPAHFDFFKINFTLSRHILSTCGDVLKVPPNTLIEISEFFMSEATLLRPTKILFLRGSIDVCNFPYLGIS